MCLSKGLTGPPTDTREGEEEEEEEEEEGEGEIEVYSQAELLERTALVADLRRGPLPRRLGYSRSKNVMSNLKTYAKHKKGCAPLSPSELVCFLSRVPATISAALRPSPVAAPIVRGRISFRDETGPAGAEVLNRSPTGCNSRSFCRASQDVPCGRGAGGSRAKSCPAGHEHTRASDNPRIR